MLHHLSAIEWKFGCDIIIEFGKIKSSLFNEK